METNLVPMETNLVPGLRYCDSQCEVTERDFSAANNHRSRKKILLAHWTLESQYRKPGTGFNNLFVAEADAFFSQRLGHLRPVTLELV
jgi:hypothetical protein